MEQTLQHDSASALDQLGLDDQEDAIGVALDEADAALLRRRAR